MMDVSRIFDAFDTSFSDHLHGDDLPHAVSRSGLGGMSIVERSLPRDCCFEWHSDYNKKIADIGFTPE